MPSEQTTRCARCGWPLKERVEDGCTADSCSCRCGRHPHCLCGYRTGAAVQPNWLAEMKPLPKEEADLLQEAMGAATGNNRECRQASSAPDVARRGLPHVRAGAARGSRIRVWWGERNEVDIDFRPHCRLYGLGLGLRFFGVVIAERGND